MYTCRIMGPLEYYPVDEDEQDDDDSISDWQYRPGYRMKPQKYIDYPMSTDNPIAIAPRFGQAHVVQHYYHARSNNYRSLETRCGRRFYSTEGWSLYGTENNEVVALSYDRLCEQCWSIVSVLRHVLKPEDD